MGLQQGPHILGARIALDDAGVPQKLARLQSAFGTAVGTVGLAAAIRSAIGEAGRFETALTKVSTLLPAGEDAVTRYGRSVENLAVKLGQSTEQVADGLFQAISASVDASKAVGFLEVAGKAAAGGFTDLRTVVDGTTSIMNAFGVSASDAQKITDAMFIANRDGKTTVEELSQSLGRVASTAAATGLSYQEMLSIIATGTKVGVQTSEVVSGLKAALAALARPSKEASDIAAEMGIRFNELSIRSYGLSGFLQKVAEKTGGSTEKLTKLFGSTEAANLMLSLMSAQGLASFRTTLGAMNEDLNLTEVNFQRASSTFEFKSRQLSEAIQRSFRAAGVAIIEGFGGDLTDLTGTAEKLESKVAAITRAIVGHVRFMADNIEGIIKTVLLYRVGAMLGSFGSKVGAAVGQVNALSGAAAAAGAAGAGGAATIGPGSILRGLGVLGQGIAIASAAFYVTEAIIESSKVQIGGVVSEAQANVANMERLAAAFGRGGVSPQNALIDRLGTTDRIRALTGNLGPAEALALRAAADPTSYLRGIDLASSTDRNAVQREFENQKKVAAFNKATGASANTLEEAQRTRDEMARALGSMMPDLIRQSTRVTEYTPITGSMNYNRTFLPLGEGLDRPASGLGITRTQELDTEALATAIGEAMARLPETAAAAIANQNEQMDRERRRAEEDGKIVADLFMQDVISPFVSAVGDFARAAQKMSEEPVQVGLSIWHKIVDGSKKKNRHSVSLQKRSAAKGLPPRYQALVVREGFGGLLVEPMPEDLVGPGMNNGGF